MGDGALPSQAATAHAGTPACQRRQAKHQVHQDVLQQAQVQPGRRSGRLTASENSGRARRNSHSVRGAGKAPAAARLAPASGAALRREPHHIEGASACVAASRFSACCWGAAAGLVLGSQGAAPQGAST